MSLQAKSDGALLMKGNGALMNACCCPIDCPTLGPRWGIKDYSDTMFTPCGNGKICGAATPWDGVFDVKIGALCLWATSNPALGHCMQSNLILTGYFPFIIYNFFTNPNQWLLSLGQEDVTNVQQTMWRGTKATGSSPAGIYTFDLTGAPQPFCTVGGSVLPNTIEVIAA